MAVTEPWLPSRRALCRPPPTFLRRPHVRRLAPLSSAPHAIEGQVRFCLAAFPTITAFTVSSSSASASTERPGRVWRRLVLRASPRPVGRLPRPTARTRTTIPIQNPSSAAASEDLVFDRTPPASILSSRPHNELRTSAVCLYVNSGAALDLLSNPPWSFLLRSTRATVNSLTGEPPTALTPPIRVPPLRHRSSPRSPPPSPPVITGIGRCHRRPALGIPYFGDGLPAHGGLGWIGWAGQFPKISLNQFI
jgi:hypothetical protein